jgi:putative sterol carrier protein
LSDSVRQFFETLEGKVDPGKTAGMNNSYVFDVGGAGQWTVRVTDGAVKVTEGAEDADVTISAASEIFEKIARGEQNPATAYMTGKLKVEGDMGAAMKLQKLF